MIVGIDVECKKFYCIKLLTFFRRYCLEGYIYNTLPIGKVEWKCIIEFVINRDRLLEMTDEHIYIPDFRKQCLKGHFKDGRKHEPSQNWIKILKFEKLRNPLKLQDFIKLDGTTVKNVRGGFVYIMHP